MLWEVARADGRALETAALVSGKAGAVSLVAQGVAGWHAVETGDGAAAAVATGPPRERSGSVVVMRIAADGSFGAHVGLSGTTLDDEDLRSLANLKQLVQLDLSGTRITDVGIRHIGSLTSLESLRLDGTDIDDAAVESLLRLPRLKTLCVSGTGMTDQGVHKLESSLEGLVVLDD